MADDDPLLHALTRIPASLTPALNAASALRDIQDASVLEGGWVGVPSWLCMPAWPFLKLGTFEYIVHNP